MAAATGMRSVVRWLAVCGGIAALPYAAYVAITWLRYGHSDDIADSHERDAIVDRFMPAYDVAERHHVLVHAPADVTFQAATEMDLQQSRIVRGIFTAREWIAHSQPPREPEVKTENETGRRGKNR